ncbi:MAG: hypothetical protein M3Z37_04070 [Candidatus Eremiobacteraeota bacterium]|nr:hypothetical protein [Candidatus Eremiobacteraeota bacterium]
MRDVKANNGFIVARVDSSGNVTGDAEAGPIIGRVTAAGDVYDDDAGVHLVGHVNGDGVVSTTNRQILGKVDAWGHVYDLSGSIAGLVETAVDAGVLLLLVTPPEVIAAAVPKPDDKGGALMTEMLELAEEYSKPVVRKDYKPLTDRDLFMEGLPRPKP